MVKRIGRVFVWITQNVTVAAGFWFDKNELKAIHRAAEIWMEKSKEKAEEEVIAMYIEGMGWLPITGQSVNQTGIKKDLFRYYGITKKELRTDEQNFD